MFWGGLGCFGVVWGVSTDPLVGELSCLDNLLLVIFFILAQIKVLALSPTGSALARTDLSPLTNGIWEIHAGCSCFLHLQLLAKIG